MVLSKFWLRSRTICINLGALVLASLAMAADSFSQLQSVLPPRTYALMAFALPIVNMILRKLTTQPIHFRTQAPEAGDGGKS